MIAPNSHLHLHLHPDQEEQDLLDCTIDASAVPLDEHELLEELELQQGMDWSLLSLPLPYEFIPNHVHSLLECAAHQIEALLQKEKELWTQNDHREEYVVQPEYNDNNDFEDAIDDGFVLCDLNVIVNKYNAWRRLFPTFRPFFALKCNPDPMVAAVLAQLGAGFDCASIAEMQLAMSALQLKSSWTTSKRCSTTTSGSLSSSIIYANPQRAEKDLDRALSPEGYNVRTLTFDGAEELYKTHRIHHQQLQLYHQNHQNHQNHNTEDTSPTAPPPLVPHMVMRILVPDQHSTVPLGEKFGVPPDHHDSNHHDHDDTSGSSQIAELAALAVDLQLPIIGISFHCGSGNHDAKAYRTAIQLACQAAQTVHQVQQSKGLPLPRCWLLDIGGGFPGLDGCGGDENRFAGHPIIRSTINGKDEEDTTTATSTAIMTARNIAEAVHPVVQELYLNDDNHNTTMNKEAASGKDVVIDRPYQFMAEPGRYFVEAAFALCSRIYRVAVDNGIVDLDDAPKPNPQQPKQVHSLHRHYYIGQGVQGLFKDCILCVPCTIHGPSGEDYDIICRDYLLPPLQVNDWLIFDRMGAYTLSIAARYGRPAIRYVIGGGDSSCSGG